MNPIYKFRGLILPVLFCWIILAGYKYFGQPLNLDFSSYPGILALLTLLALFFWLGGFAHKSVSKVEIDGSVVSASTSENLEISNRKPEAKE